MFEQAKAKAKALATTALAHGVKNAAWSIEKDGGVFTPKAIAKSAVTYGAALVAVEVATGSLFFGLVTGVLADCGRIQVEGRLYEKQSAKIFREEQDIRDALFEEDVHNFEDDYYPGLFAQYTSGSSIWVPPFETAEQAANREIAASMTPPREIDPFETACEIPDVHLYRGE